MATLLARGCTPELAQKVKAYARTEGLSVSDAVAHLLDVGLVSVARMTSAGLARWEGTTPEARSAAMSRASRARWDRTKGGGQ